MKSHDGFHAESQTILPGPLTGAGVWNVGALALPAVLLSACSAAVFATVLLFLRMGSARELFLLPFPGAFAIGAVAAAIAWMIALKCRRRPGRLWPRIWVLLLAAFNSAIALLATAFHDRPVILALAVAGLAAAATLVPRLGKLRPDSPLVQWVAPLSVALILLFILPASCAVRRAITEKTEDRVEQRIQQVRLWTVQVREATGFEWRRMEEQPAAAADAVAKLKALRFAGAVDDAEVWRSAAVLRKDEELASAVRGLTREVVAGLAPERAPRVSDLREAAVRWDAQAGRWESYRQFATLSEVTGSYHQELGRLFGELASQDESTTNPKLVDYREHYAAQHAVLRQHLDSGRKSWPDNWAIVRAGGPHTPLAEILRTSFLEGEEGSLAAAQLGQLTTLPLQRLKSMARGAPGCEGGEPGLGGGRGCQCQNYEERGRDYFRLDCYSYAPQREGTGAELRVEMRVVYQSPAGSSLDRYSLPAELYFHFLVPHGIGTEEFREEVMTELATASRGFLRDGSVRSTDRGGSVAGGFVLDDGRLVVRVLRPVVVPLTGLEPERKALLVRVVRASDRRRRIEGGDHG
ncbi:MAG TPA: hypothetical protein VGF69_17155 [Thermoanaerobaculia bacterium]|jgi:hypothetical protein